MTIIRDTFDRADTGSPLGTTSDGNATWTAVTGAWGIDTGCAWASALASEAWIDTANSALATIPSAADTTVSVTIGAGGAGYSTFCGVVVRAIDHQNFLLFGYDAVGGTPGGAHSVSLWRVKNGFTDLAFLGTAGPFLTPGELKVRAIGSTIKCYVDGELVITATETFAQTATAAGLYTESSTNRFDGFTEVPASTSIVDDFTRANTTSGAGITSDGNGLWTDLFGTSGIATDAGYFPSLAGGFPHGASTVDAVSADGSISIDVSANDNIGNDAGLIFRASDVSNYLLVQASGAVWKCVAGTLSFIGSFTDHANGTLEVDLSGSTITVKWNGVTQGTFTDGFNATATRHGIYAATNVPRLDNFSFSSSSTLTIVTTPTEAQTLHATLTLLSGHMIGTATEAQTLHGTLSFTAGVSIPVGPGYEVNAEDQQLVAVLSVSPAPIDPPAGWLKIPTLSYTYPSPVIVNGQPTDGSGGPWLPTAETRGTWAWFDIVVGGKNVTSFRTYPDGNPIFTIVERWTDKDPGGDDQLDLVFPGVTSYDHLGTGVLSWLYGSATVVVRKLTLSGTTKVTVDIFEGVVGPIDDIIVEPGADGLSSTITVHCEGLWTRLDDFITLPRTQNDPIDSGDWIRSQVNRAQAFGWPGQKMPHKHTGIETVEVGSYGARIASDTVTQALALMQTASTVYTVGLKRPKRLVITERVWDGTSVFSLVCGQRGVTHTLTIDPTTAKNAIYGHGQAPFGPVDPTTGEQPALADWMNWQYPIAYINPPTYPLPVGSVCCANLFCPGCSATGFRPFSDELRAQGYPLKSGDAYRSDDEDEVSDYQNDHGIQVDGIVGPQTWNTAFQVGQNSKALTDAYIREIVSGKAQQPYILNARGAILSLNPAFDPVRHPRREMLEQFGPISKKVATQSARLQWTRIQAPYYVGTVTAKNVDPPEMCALDTRSGMTMTLRSHAGTDRKLYVAQVERVPGMRRESNPDRKVTWTVSERPDDIMTLVQRLERDRGVKDVVYSNRPPRHYAKQIPNWPIFDAESGAGIQQPEAQIAGLWNKYLIPMGTHLDVNAVKIVASVSCKMAAAIFANPNLTVSAMIGGGGSGLANPSAGVDDPWAKNQKRLITQGIMWSTGNPTAMQGYWPNEPGGTETGVLADNAPWKFRSTAGVFASLFVWTDRSCRVSGDPNFGYRVVFPAPIGG